MDQSAISSTQVSSKKGGFENLMLQRVRQVMEDTSSARKIYIGERSRNPETVKETQSTPNLPNFKIDLSKKHLSSIKGKPSLISQIKNYDQSSHTIFNTQEGVAR